MLIIKFVHQELKRPCHFIVVFAIVKIFKIIIDYH